MPSRFDRILFIVGHAFFLCALVLINSFGSSTKAETAIDYPHWLMLLSSVLQIPFATRLPQRGISLLASWLMLLGIVGIVGMCVLDFVFWSLPDPDLRMKVARELATTPSLWQPFMMWGTEELPCLGFALASLTYLKDTKLGSCSVVAGAILSVAGGGWYNVAGRMLITLGFAENFKSFQLVNNTEIQRCCGP